MPTPLTPQPIDQVARELGLSPEHLEPYGHGKAKVDLAVLRRNEVPRGALVLVSAINPTPAGEGKTTTSIGLAMGLRRMGKRVALCLREPSLGPVFGVKGGGTGGGKATLVPADDINLHFTGDIHAITSAHNLLSAMIDNACHFQEPTGSGKLLDAGRITWGRAMDMNDRALRNVIVGLGRASDGVPRQDRFDITAASEIMAIVALAEGMEDLQERLQRVVLGSDRSGTPITAGDLGAAPAMTALLRDALKPNLVQTAEGGPALVHAGPFANIAHGCNSILATRMGLQMSDIVVTEAGFGFDLGGEKFLDIKCRQLGTWPRVLVLVATLRALKAHGGAKLAETKLANLQALEAGLPHLEKHLETAKTLALPVLVAINVFPDDTKTELDFLRGWLKQRGVPMASCTGFAEGGAGAAELSDACASILASAPSPTAHYAYDLNDATEEKFRKVARLFYGADDITVSATARKTLAALEHERPLGLPVCMAKTQLSLSDDPLRIGRPTGFSVNVRDVRLASGAGFLVALTGDMMTMPGLPKRPAALGVQVLPNGKIKGLMQND